MTPTALHMQLKARILQDVGTAVDEVAINDQHQLVFRRRYVLGFYSIPVPRDAAHADAIFFEVQDLVTPLLRQFYFLRVKATSFKDLQDMVTIVLTTFDLDVLDEYGERAAAYNGQSFYALQALLGDEVMRLRQEGHEELLMQEGRCGCHDTTRFNFIDARTKAHLFSYTVYETGHLSYGVERCDGKGDWYKSFIEEAMAMAGLTDLKKD